MAKMSTQPSALSTVPNTPMMPSRSDSEMATRRQQWLEWEGGRTETSVEPDIGDGEPDEGGMHTGL